MSKRRDEFRHRPRIIGSQEEPSLPRAGDHIGDGIGGVYEVQAAFRGRLLLRDTDGKSFVLQAFRLNHEDKRVLVPSWYWIKDRK